jgi:hypothetical protein
MIRSILIFGLPALIAVSAIRARVITRDDLRELHASR